MKKKQINLSTKITVLVSLLIVVLLLPSAIITSNRKIDEMITRIENNCMNTAQIIARDNYIIDNLSIKDPNKLIQPYISSILDNIDDIEYIVVTDMDNIRYSHPIEEKIGHAGLGTDSYQVINDGETYISKGIGSLGEAVRAFVPVYDNNNIQIGFVAVGILLDDINEIRMTSLLTSLYISIIGIILGIIGAILLSINIKKSISGLEPYEIGRLYNEKKGMLNAIHEGIIAIDNNNKITMINNSAISILSLKSENSSTLIGEDINKVFPENQLSNILKIGTPEHNKQVRLNNAVIFANRVPIIENNEVIGAIATFSDRTEVVKLAEEITGIKQITDGLRANNHEFMNKLHVILGLAHNERYSELKDYIVKISKSKNIIAKDISEKISNPQIEALLIGKFSRASELGIELKLFDDSYLSESSIAYNNYLITILGNLIENAFEAIIKNPSSATKKVSIGIVEEDDDIEIIVQDSGIGLKEEEKAKIFLKGYSTKSENSGTGLFLVKKSVEALNGEINIESEHLNGTYFQIIIKKVDNYD